MRVVLPEPEVPMRATNSPWDTVREMPLQHRHVDLAQVIGLINVLQFYELHLD